MLRRARMSIAAVVATAAVLATSLVAPLGTQAPAAQAAPSGTIAIGAAADVSATTLFGDRVAMTLSATNDTTTNAYNLAFRAILPAGTPTGSVATATPNMPAPTVTTLPQPDGRVMAVWSNVADLVAGATVELDVTFLAPPAFTIGDDVLVDVAAAASTNPRNLAGFTSSGATDLDGETGANTASATTELAAFEVTKSEPSTESELLRGVQDHATVYTITVRNNLETPTSGISIVDHLSAGLEFLGCGLVDASPVGTEEYPGAGRIPAFDQARFAGTPCVAPTSVTTVQTDPDGSGPLPLDVYTRVEWSTQTLASAGIATTLAARTELRIAYAAAVPLRENALPAPAISTANLENNTGDLTTDEQSLVNHVAGTGTTLGAVRTVTTTHEVVAEDVSIHKSVQESTTQHGATSTWTLVIESSEYATSSGPITVVDTIPTALDFVSSDTPHTVTEDGDQRFVTWQLEGFATPNGTQTITYTTRTRTDYRGAAAVAAADSWTNEVELVAPQATVITANDGTTSQLRIEDASAAGQSTGIVELAKDVANAPAAGATLDCSTVDATQWSPETAAGAFAVGDRVCWRITADFPDAVDTLDVTVTDFLPTGFALDADAPITYTGSVQPTAEDQPAIDGSTITWSLGDVVAAAPGQTFVAIIPTTVTSVSATATTGQDITANLAKLSYRNTQGDVLQLRDDASVVRAAPLVTIDKSTTRTTAVAGGDVVPFTVAVRNGGTVTVTGVDVRDVLPAGITCAMVSDQAACSTIADGRVQLQWNDIALAVGETATRTYSVTIPDTFRPGASLVNTAGVLEYVTTANTGTSTTHVPANNIDSSRTPTPGTAAARDAQTITVAGFGLSKSNTTSVNEAGNAAVDRATIGETITYTIRATIPAGTTVSNFVVADELPTNPVRLEVTGASATLNGQPLPTAGFAVTTPVAGPRVTGPTSYTNAAGSGADVIELIVTARVLDVAANAHGTTITNTARVSTDGTSRITRQNTVTVVEPNVSILKSHDDADGRVSPGQVLTYTVTPQNAQGAATAHDLTVVDELPADLVPIDAGGAPLADGAVLPNGGTWDAETRTFTWTLARLAPGASQPYAYRVQVASPLTAGTTLRNTVEVEASSLAGDADGERVGTDSATGYAGTTGIDVAAPEPTIAKTAIDETPTIGESIQYRLVVTIPANTTVHDVTVLDQLPAGIVYDGFTAASSASGTDALTATPLQQREATGTIGFFLGDVAPATVERTLTITVDAYVARSATSGQTLTNTARVHFNATDVISGIPGTMPTAESFSGASAPSSDDVAIIAPVLAIDKDVVGQVGDDDWRRAKPGETLTYTIVASNTGTAPAYDVVVTDAIDPRLLASVDDLTDLAQADGVEASVADGVLTWTIAGPIAAGSSVEIRYTVQIPAEWDDAQEVVDDEEVVNTATLSGFGLPSDDRAANQDRHPVYGGEQLRDEVRVELDLASIGDTVWYDVDGDGIVGTDEPRLARIPVTVTYLGEDGVLGTADDESYPTVTDQRGEWVVEHLPGGAYVVTVDAAAVAAAVPGLVPSHDGVGQTDAPDGAWVGSLGEGDARRDLEIGFRGLGAVGSVVWFDQDADGVQDAAEPGLPDVRVRITWQGARDMAPVTRIVETDAIGRYGLDGLPFGVVDVQVLVEDSAALDTYEQVSAVSNATLDDTSRATLTAEAPHDLDLDFGYAGTGSIGDLVWLDQDGDGVRQPTESGLANVTIELVFTDLAGVETTLSTQTGADGAYLFDRLPAGRFSVSVENQLLAGVDNTGYPGRDPESTELGDSTASGALGAGQEIGTIDFGYRAQTLLGQHVWLDLDGDGARETGEPGLEGVTVVATGPQGARVTTVTDENGAYLFENLVPGEWTVTIGEGLPAGVTQSFDADGIGTPDSSTVTLDGAGSLTQDFGYVGAGALGDRVWLDQDADGAVGGGERGLEGVTVTLTWQRGGELADIVLTTVTSPDGTYGFAGLPAGTYAVRTDALDAIDGIEPTFDLDGGVETPGDGGTVSLAADETRDDVDFGYRGSASVGDLVWLDRDASGTAEGELGLAGVTVTLTWQRGGELDDVVLTTVTDADGGYAFEHLAPGTYLVQVDASTLPAGLAATYDEDELVDGATTVTVAEGDVHDTVDFGYRGAGTVGDRVWLDLDGLGDQGEAEPGIPGQSIELTWLGRDSEPSADDLVFTTTTGVDGAYGFAGLPDGAYVVRVDGGVVDHAANTGNPQERSDATATLVLGDEAGRARDDQDFGFQGGGAIGDLVWWDEDGDGVRDESETSVEPALGGVTVELVWFGPDGEPGTSDDVRLPDVVTAADGAYLHAGLPSGDYLVHVGQGVPAGLEPSVAAGDTETPTRESRVTLDPEVEGGMQRLDQDFGFTGSGSLGDLVWLDLDGDGERTDGEPGLEGVTVTVTWHGPDGGPGTGDERTWTTTVADDGAWLVDRLPAGTFDVVLSGVPAGLVPSADPDGGDDAQASTTLEPGQVRDELDFGFVGGAGVGDTIWLEVDGDGSQSEVEPGVPGVVVTVTSAGVDGELGTDDDLVVRVVTDADGHYLVGGLPTGATSVTYDPTTLPAGTAPVVTIDESGEPVAQTGVELVLEPGQLRDDVDFPVRGTQSLSGVVWVDEDGDGVHDEGEPGIPGVTVVATWDGPLGPIELTVVTGEDGGWTLPSVPAGDWTVRVDLDTVPPHLVGSTPASVVVQVPVDGVGAVEHGLVPTGTVGDTVFHDEDRDGVQDAGERGISGVTVRLVDAQGSVVAETVTDADGRYLFEDVAPGDHVVRIDLSTVPEGYEVTQGTAEIAVAVGPDESVLDADFPLALPVVVAPAPLPRTGAELPLALLGVTLLLLLAGAVLLVARRRRVA